MSALYPLRMNSKYQTKIEELECMGFDPNKAAQYLEEHDGKVVCAIEELLQHEDSEEDVEVEDYSDQSDVDEDEDDECFDESDDDNPNENDCEMDQSEARKPQFQHPDPLWNALTCVAIVLIIALTCELYEKHSVVSTDTVDANTFNTMYDFEDDVLFGDDEVIIKHMYHYDAYLHLQSPDTDALVGKYHVSNDAAIWRLQRAHEDGMTGVKLVSKESGKYLRIHQGGNEINAGGNGGAFTLFHATLVEAKQHHLKGVRLQSAKYPEKYVAIASDGRIEVTEDCDGNVDCVLIFMTTQRSLQLKNFKNELKVVELEQEIERLKHTIKTLTTWIDDPYPQGEVHYQTGN
eukprot:567043_1